MFVIKVKCGEMGIMDTIFSINSFSGEELVMKGFNNVYRVTKGTMFIIDADGKNIFKLDSIEILESKNNHSYTELAQVELDTLIK